MSFLAILRVPMVRVAAHISVPDGSKHFLFSISKFVSCPRHRVIDGGEDYVSSIPRP